MPVENTSTAINNCRYRRHCKIWEVLYITQREIREMTDVSAFLVTYFPNTRNYAQKLILMVSAEFNILYFDFVISFTHMQVMENGIRMQHILESD
jgi:hypothetical protein